MDITCQELQQTILLFPYRGWHQQGFVVEPTYSVKLVDQLYDLEPPSFFVRCTNTTYDVSQLGVRGATFNYDVASALLN